MYGESNMGICCMIRGTQTGLCNNPEGRDGEWGGREFEEGGDIGTSMSDSCRFWQKPTHCKEIILQLKINTFFLNLTFLFNFFCLPVLWKQLFQRPNQDWQSLLHSSWCGWTCVFMLGACRLSGLCSYWTLRLHSVPYIQSVTVCQTLQKALRVLRWVERIFSLQEEIDSLKERKICPKYWRSV